jgi:hydroxypyruvate reductase
MRAGHVDPSDALRRNDSNTALASSGDLLVTGPTGTNVMDVQILLRGPASRA